MLPPPDPFESTSPSDDFSVTEPTAMFLKGNPNEADDRVADAILSARPGLLVVCLRP